MTEAEDAVGRLPPHGLSPPRSHRPPRQPLVPRHDELRSRDRRGHQPPHHGRRARRRDQLLRHRQRLRRPARRSRSSAAGSRRAATGARRWCWPRRCTAAATRGRTRRGSRPSTSARRARTASAGSRPTTSTCTRCTTSTATRRGTRSGRRWSSSSPRARSSTSAARTSPAGTSSRPTRRPAGGARSGSSRSRACTTCAPARSSSRCCRRPPAYGIGILPWSPLGGGLLGGALQKATEGRRGGERVTKLVERNRDQLEAWEALCAELGEEPADVALAWLLHQPTPSPRRSSGRGRWTSSRGAFRALDDHPRPRRPSSPRQDLPRPRRRRPGGVRLVGRTPCADASCQPDAFNAHQKGSGDGRVAAGEQPRPARASVLVS